ncbi:DUF2842 domain-containing protein [Frigidibacter oleivorans]|uniref:DUF2842 domain-containing protein n=1 Tax=Frigidibacter oleivorans TaxID=2487129 RepID=UPI000F8F6255|nr:DUF2842 domain-containing protein [Frigidibacter oleivorans]
MALGYRTRRRLSLLILLVGMPLYVVAAVTAVNWMDRSFGRQPIWVELLVYVALGFLWALPFRRVFRGVGQADPEDGANRPPRD